MARRGSPGAVLAAVAVAVALLAAPAAARPAPEGVVADGLSNPRGIASINNWTVLVAESGSGSITLVKQKRKGPARVSTLAELPADPETGLGPVDVATKGLAKTWVLLSGPPEEEGGEGTGELLRLDRKGRVNLTIDIAAYQQGDPDPDDQDDFPEESNPNGLALLRGGGVLVADAANNDLLLVDRSKQISTVARFLREDVPWPAGLPFGPPPGTPVPAESVPTAVAIGPDGAWYVSELKGFPFVKGTSRIWRIEPGSVNAVCDPARPDTGPCRTVGTGFSSVIDLAFGPDGTMVVLEIAKEGLLAVEFFGAPPVGALWAVDGGTKTELAEGELLFPGGVSVSQNGSLTVTTGAVFGPGAGTVVRVNP